MDYERHESYTSPAFTGVDEHGESIDCVANSSRNQFRWVSLHIRKSTVTSEMRRSDPPPFPDNSCDYRMVDPKGIHDPLLFLVRKNGCAKQPTVVCYSFSLMRVFASSDRF